MLLFVLLFSLGNLIQIPGWLFLAAAVLTLGRLWGGVVTYVAAVTSCALTFVTIRSIGGDALRSIDNRVAVRILRQLDAHPVRSVALLRVLFQTAPPLNYALALSGIRLRVLSGRHAARPAAADRRVLHLLRPAGERPARAVADWSAPDALGRESVSDR